MSTAIASAYRSNFAGRIAPARSRKISENKPFYGYQSPYSRQAHCIKDHKETRVETYPFARDAVREAVYNALIHCNWADNNPIQIRIEDDAMYISNSSLLPFGWTAQTLLETHSSKPFNPDIARVFYRAGYIESWGRGIQKICDACKNLGVDAPVYIVHGEDIMVKFHALKSAKVPSSKDSGSVKTQTRNFTKRNGGRTGDYKTSDSKENDSFERSRMY